MDAYDGANLGFVGLGFFWPVYMNGSLNDCLPNALQCRKTAPPTTARIVGPAIGGKTALAKGGINPNAFKIKGLTYYGGGTGSGRGPSFHKPSYPGGQQSRGGRGGGAMNTFHKRHGV